MPDSGARSEGFTLIELMVVLVIIGLAAAAVVLAMPDEGGSLAAEAERFAARAKAARDQAILESRSVSLAVGPGGYQVARREREGWRAGARYQWTAETRPEAAATIVFDPTGFAEPARVTLRRRERRAAIDIAADGNVHVAR